MSVSLDLRRVAISLIALAAMNGLVALVLAYNSPLYQPDDVHTFAITYRGGVTRFYTPAVGVYLICSGVLGGLAGGVFGLWRVFGAR